MAKNKPTEETTQTAENEERVNAKSDAIFSFNDISKYTHLILYLSKLYNSILKRVSNRGIPLLLTTVLCVVITGVKMSDVAITSWDRDVIWWFYTIVEQVPIYWCLPLLGFTGIDPAVARDRIDIIIEYLRVSSQDQSKKSGKQRQKNTLGNEIGQVNYDKKIEISDDWESASTMLRANIDKIIEIVRDYPDKTVALAIEDVDRLSRAPPFEAAVFLWVLSRFDVIFYFGDIGYYDFSDPEQQLMAFFALYRSRQDYNHIIERTSSGQKDIKEKGGCPSKTPFGYSKIDTESHKLEINKQQAEVINEAVERILSAEDPVVKSIWEDLRDGYESDLEYFPAYGSFLHILRNEKYIGDITHDGEVVGHMPQIMSKEDHNRVIEKIGTPDNEENDELDHALQSIIDRFGIDGSISLFDIIKGRCPDCGGDVKTMGSAERWGNRVLRYKCVGSSPDSQETTEEECENATKLDNPEEDNNSDGEPTVEGCEFSGPLLSRSFLQAWERGLPIVCPRCQTPADEDDWEKLDTKINAVEQTCDECGLWYSADVSIEYDSPVERGINIPNHAIRWFDDTESDSDDEERNCQSTDSNNTSTDGNQQEIGSFS